MQNIHNNFCYFYCLGVFKKFKYFLAVLWLLTSTEFYATHIIGGELYYDYLGSNNYKITLKLFRDCDGQTANFDGLGLNAPPAFLHIFNSSGALVKQLNLGAPSVTKIAGSIQNPCIFINAPCVEQGVYVITTTLSPQVGGYNLVYQRCCRNNNVDNLLNSGNQGSSFISFIPGPELATINNSPRFTNFPPIDICNGLDLTFNHAATDADGDVLIYSFTKPLDGLDACCPGIGSYTNSCVTPNVLCPTTSSPPPYPFVTYAGTFNENYPVAANPSLTINSSTGLLQGKPNLVGTYAVGVCVEEWRNGNLLSKHYRDFQFAVRVCTVSVVAAIAEQSQNCIGQTITFTNTSVNQSANPNYFWDFGDLNILGDTSLVNSPSYTYQDTGIYYATLTVNRGGLCTDTVKKTIYVYPILNINFTKPNTYCVKSNSVNFSTSGVFLSNSTIYNWSFPSASPPTSTLQNPTGIQFTSSGLFSVTLIAKQFACKDTFVDSIRILNRPIAKINNFPTQLCDPGKISFSNGSISEYPSSYWWNTSDGVWYSNYEPTHTFSPAGIYSISLTMYRGAPCPDTSLATFKTITINPLPIPGFAATPSVTSIFEPEINVQNTGEGGITNCSYDFGDGTSSNFLNDIHSYTLPGKYKIVQTVSNVFNCVAITEKEIRILPEFRFWVPSAFTPDENNLNETFMPVTIGVRNYKFTVYDKWGHVLFETNEPNKGWDGKSKGKTCKQDVYIWKVQYFNDVSEKNEAKTGHFSLLNDSGEF